MSTTNLLNIAVAITVSDPWEFGTQCGVGPFSGCIVEQHTDAVAVRLDRPLSYAGQALVNVVIRARHVGASIAALGQGQEIAANFLFTSNGEAALQGVATGVAAIGSVRST